MGFNRGEIQKKIGLLEEAILVKGVKIKSFKEYPFEQSNLHFMSLFFSIPRRVRIKLEKIQRDFMWDSHLQGSIMHLVNWRIICKDKKYGRLRTRRLKVLN